MVKIPNKLKSKLLYDYWGWIDLENVNDNARSFSHWLSITHGVKYMNDATAGGLYLYLEVTFENESWETLFRLRYAEAINDYDF